MNAFVTNANAKTKERSFGLRDKLSYMMGDFGCNCSFALISSYFMLFYVTVLGINPVHYGIIILITKIWDGINDPIIGALTDFFKPREGKDKFRPWIKFTALPMAIVTVVMFLYFPGFPYWVKLLQCIISYVLWDTCYTCINVPYGSLQSVITANPVERAELSKYRTIGALLAQMPIGIMLPMILFVGENPVGIYIKCRYSGSYILSGIHPVIPRDHRTYKNHAGGETGEVQVY